MADQDHQLQKKEEYAMSKDSVLPSRAIAAVRAFVVFTSGVANHP
jgi:hypothetical protein